MTVTFQAIGESEPGPVIVVRVGTVIVQIQIENAILRVVIPIAATPGHPTLTTLSRKAFSFCSA